MGKPILRDGVTPADSAITRVARKAIDMRDRSGGGPKLGGAAAFSGHCTAVEP
jgi:hypothetical protein